MVSGRPDNMCRPLPEGELLAGIKVPEDFIVDHDVNGKLLTIYRQMSVDPDINHHVTFNLSTWKELPLDVRVLVAVLYESYLGKQLFNRPEIPVLEKKTSKSAKK